MLKVVCLTWALKVVGRLGPEVILRVLGGIEFLLGLCGIYGKLFEKEGGNYMLACSFHEGEHYNSKS